MKLTVLHPQYYLSLAAKRNLRNRSSRVDFRQARDILAKIGIVVQWKQYAGADEEGHWLKEPEELDDIAAFFQAIGKHEKRLM